jgi:hypothetical protein
VKKIDTPLFATIVWNFYIAAQNLNIPKLDSFINSLSSGELATSSLFTFQLIEFSTFTEPVETAAILNFKDL